MITRYKLKMFTTGLAICLWLWGCSREVKVLPVSERYPRPDAAEIKQDLTPVQFKVTQQDGTEQPFKNEYWDNERAGIYVDIVSGEPLFSSHQKYKSGTGWPSFWKPLVDEHVVQQLDRKLPAHRQEVRSKFADSHLGHVFDDGPEPTGLRYCINSAALRFIEVEDLASAGYPEFVPLFDEP